MGKIAWNRLVSIESDKDFPTASVKNSSGLNLAALQSNIPAVNCSSPQIPSYFQAHTVITVHIWMQSLSPKTANGLGKTNFQLISLATGWSPDKLRVMFSDVKGRKMKAHFFFCLFLMSLRLLATGVWASLFFNCRHPAAGWPVGQRQETKTHWQFELIISTSSDKCNCVCVRERWIFAHQGPHLSTARLAETCAHGHFYVGLQRFGICRSGHGHTSCSDLMSRVRELETVASCCNTAELAITKCQNSD